MRFTQPPVLRIAACRKSPAHPPSDLVGRRDAHKEREGKENVHLENLKLVDVEGGILAATKSWRAPREGKRGKGKKIIDSISAYAFAGNKPIEEVLKRGGGGGKRARHFAVFRRSCTELNEAVAERDARHMMGKKRKGKIS